MDLAYVDNRAKDNSGVKFLLDRQDFFDWTVVFFIEAWVDKLAEFAGVL